MPSSELWVVEIAYRSLSGLHVSELPVSKRTCIEINSFETTNQNFRSMLSKPGAELSRVLFLLAIQRKETRNGPPGCALCF